MFFEQNEEIECMDVEGNGLKKRSLLIFVIVVLFLALLAVVYVIYHQKQQMSEMQIMYSLEKDELTDEYAELSLQYEGVKFSVGNDSLVALLTTEQMKVQRLMEELRTIKTTNVRRIHELKKELETLRKIMRNYVIQIDSLNAENEQLRNENKKVVQKYQQVSSAAAKLTKEKEKLTERVSLASRMDAVAIVIDPVNKRGKKSKSIDKTTQLVLSFQIAKNVTAPIGEKELYVRIMKPDDDILRKPNSGVFLFENREITYSMKKTIEYEGEEMSVVMYWDVEEYLSSGAYRVDIFADGNLIGRKSFSL